VLSYSQKGIKSFWKHHFSDSTCHKDNNDWYLRQQINKFNAIRSILALEREHTEQSGNKIIAQDILNSLLRHRRIF
jgi:uncharacterized protein (DUF427 family)